MTPEKRKMDEPQRTALVVVDMLNPYDHEDADQLTPGVEEMVPDLRDLVQRARDEDVLVVYVNDNYGGWTSSREDLVDAACNGERPDLVKPIVPTEDTAFVIKARHSIFYSTPLEYLLGQEGVDHIVLAGQVTEQCILYSALDAYVRHHHVSVPRDAVAHIDGELADAALTMMERNMDAWVGPAADLEMVSGQGP
jgi:nicotinamidase-related amidase